MPPMSSRRTSKSSTSFRNCSTPTARHALLVVFQAMDAGGKDGAIEHVFSGVNPQGCTVTSFKVPSTLESKHDFLWRIHKACPPKGMIGIFNRSHYESVLVERVHKLVPTDVWKIRYDHINNFEKLLADEGTTIIKFFLHISKEEQKRRFQDRLKDKDKNWKFSTGDLKERALWGEYQNAFKDALEKCSTKKRRGTSSPPIANGSATGSSATRSSARWKK